MTPMKNPGFDIHRLSQYCARLEKENADYNQALNLAKAELSDLTAQLQVWQSLYQGLQADFDNAIKQWTKDKEWKP